MKLGRRCPRASPYNVNCETTSAAPLTSSRERFILPCSSSKIRRFATFSARDAATAGVSSRPTPSKIISPLPISPVTRPSTVTLARLTLCTTARIQISYSFRGLLSRLSWQLQSSASLRRRLTLWTEITATPRDNRAPDHSAAAITGLALAPVGTMVALIFARLAFGVKKIGDGRAAHNNRFLQDFTKYAMQRGGLLPF